MNVYYDVPFFLQIIIFFTKLSVVWRNVLWQNVNCMLSKSVLNSWVAFHPRQRGQEATSEGEEAGGEYVLSANAVPGTKLSSFYISDLT